MFNTHSAGTSTDPSQSTSTETQPRGYDHYISSTPRSELNKHAADPNTISPSSDVATQTDEFVDPGKRLSAAGANASLYKIPRADPKDLPSFPSRGLNNLESSASKAALLAASNQKSPELWKPGPLPAAGAAAVLARDSHKSPEVWQPGSPSSNASRAAYLVKDNKPAEVWKPATGPNALTAAGHANKPQPKPKAPEPPRTPAYDIQRVNQMASQNAQNRLSTAHPPMPQTQADKNKSDVLRAASISMAKKPSQSSPTTAQPAGYYSHIPTTSRHTTTADDGLNRRNSLAAASRATNDANHSPSTSTTTDRPVRYYPHLEEAARKAASERLARLQAEHDNHRKASGLPPSWQAGQRAVSSADPSDMERSRKIKADTAKLQKQIEDVDREKQARDHLKLLALAEKNVKARMEALEEKAAMDQGRVPKHLQAEWDAKAKLLSEEYEAKRNKERDEKSGKIDMGGGLWYDKEDLERIARGNVQPILDEINEKAAAERARQEQLRLEKEELERRKKLQAERDAETKAELKKAKALEKAEQRSKREAERQEERNRKAEAKSLEQERKNKEKAEKEGHKKEAAFATAMAAGGTSEIKAHEGPETTKEVVDQDHNISSVQPHAETERPGTSGTIEADKKAIEPPMTKGQYEQELAALAVQPQHDQVQHIEPRPISRDNEEHQKDEKPKKSWFGSIGRRLSRKDKHDKEPEKSNIRDKISDPIPYVAADDEVSSLSSSDKDEPTGSVRDVAMAGTDQLSPVSDEKTFEPIGRAQRGYISSDSSSSTSSDDLYSDNYRGITSATYAPGDDGDMPVAVPDDDASSISSKKITTRQDDDQDVKEGGLAAAPVHTADPSTTIDEKREESKDLVQEEAKHGYTIGSLLKSTFAGFTKKDVDAEVEKEKAHQPELKHNEEGAAGLGHEAGTSSVDDTKGGPWTGFQKEDIEKAQKEEKQEQQALHTSDKLEVKPDAKDRKSDEFSEARDTFDEEGGVAVTAGEGVRKISGDHEHGARTSKFNEIW